MHPTGKLTCMRTEWENGLSIGMQGSDVRLRGIALT